MLTPWRTHTGNYADQKMKIRPVCAGAQFRFRIFFENLTPAELALLVRSIRPAPAVRYKLGLGKPLGLGTVRLDPDDHVALYQFATRYSEAGLDKTPASQLAFRETSDITSAATLSISSAYLALHARQYSNVSYPQVTHTGAHMAADPELKLYEWFVANDQDNGNNTNNQPRNDAKCRALEVLDDEVRALPTFDYTPPLGE